MLDEFVLQFGRQNLHFQFVFFLTHCAHLIEFLLHEFLLKVDQLFVVSQTIVAGHHTALEMSNGRLTGMWLDYVRGSQLLATLVVGQLLVEYVALGLAERIVAAIVQYSLFDFRLFVALILFVFTAVDQNFLRQDAVIVVQLVFGGIVIVVADIHAVGVGDFQLFAVPAVELFVLLELARNHVE